MPARPPGRCRRSNPRRSAASLPGSSRGRARRALPWRPPAARPAVRPPGRQNLPKRPRTRRRPDPTRLRRLVPSCVTPGGQWSGPRAPEYTGSARAYRSGVGQNPSMAPMQPVQTRCCIAGGGPAGMMLGVLLARAGVDVLVLEKHADFLRDFRGDTVHPSTLDVLGELGWLGGFLRRPHQELARIRAHVEGTELTIADFGHAPTREKFIAFMPQWDFL